MDLKFLENFQMELEFIKLEFLEWYLSSINFLIFFNFFNFLLSFLSFIAYNSIFYKSSFTLKINFEKIEFQNRDILLYSFKTGTYR